MIEVLMMGAGVPMVEVGSWTQLALTGTKPSIRYIHTLTSVGNKLYLHGGRVGITNRDELWEYDVVNNVWTELQPTGTKPSGRSGHTLVSVGSKLYLHGGSPDGINSLGDLWEYDIENNAWIELQPTGVKPSSRFNHTLVSVEDKLYLYGGYPGGTSRLGDLWAYDIVNNTWTQLALTGTKPSSRSHHTLASVGDKLYLYGGEPSGGDQLWEYDTVNNVWTELQPTGLKPSGRYGHKLTSVGDKLYLHGGSGNRDDLWEYDTVDNEWLLLEPAGLKPSGRYLHTLTNVGSKLYLHGGFSGSTYRDDLWEYTIPE